GTWSHAHTLFSPWIAHGSCFGRTAVKVTPASVVRYHVNPPQHTVIPTQSNVKGRVSSVQPVMAQRSQTSGRKVCSAHRANCWRLTLSAPAGSSVQSCELTSVPTVVKR